MGGELHEGKDSTTNPLGWLIRVVKTLGFEHLFKRYYGTYRGIVVDNEDPDGLGRVRVLVPAIGHKTPDDVHPDIWAWPKFPGLAVGEKGGQVHGVYWPGDVGDQVWVEFEGGESQFPIYCGGWIPKTDFEGDQLINEKALYKGFRTKSGHWIRFSDDPEDLHITITKGDGAGVESGTFLTMDKDENVVMSNATGALVFLKEDQAVMFAPDGCNMQLGDGKAMLMDNAGNSFGLEGGKFQVLCDEVTMTAASKITLKSSVDIGVGPVYQPAVLGQIFSTLYNTHIHTATAPGAPTTPQTTPPVVVNMGLSLGVRVS